MLKNEENLKMFEDTLFIRYEKSWQRDNENRTKKKRAAIGVTRKADAHVGTPRGQGAEYEAMPKARKAITLKKLTANIQRAAFRVMSLRFGFCSS
jgi:hypothetical protein